MQSLPSDFEWSRVTLTCEEVGELRYLNHNDWLDLSERSRLVGDGAANVDRVEVGNGVNQKIRGIEQALHACQSFPEIIIVAPDRDASHIVLEGHGRATAYYRAHPSTTEIEAFAGRAEAIEGWDKIPWK